MSFLNPKNFLDGVVDDWMKDVDARVQFGIKFGKSRGFIKSGDPIVIVTGWKSGSGFTNTLRIVYVDDNLGGYNY